MPFNQLMIATSARYAVIKQILGSSLTLESAKAIDQWLRARTSDRSLPTYESSDYVGRAIALFQLEFQQVA